MFPRGLAVGILTSVETKDQATFQTASTVPIVDFSRLNIVFVIRSFDPIWVGR
jgi:cell shape-determining protein MreC